MYSGRGRRRCRFEWQGAATASAPSGRAPSPFTTLTSNHAVGTFHFDAVLAAGAANTLHIINRRLLCMGQGKTNMKRHSCLR